MRSTIFWNISACSPWKVNRRFGGKCPLHLQSQRMSQERNACHLLSRWFLARFILLPWRWRQLVPPERRSTFNGLHDVIFQKIVLFIATAVRTSNRTMLCNDCSIDVHCVLYVHPPVASFFLVPSILRCWSSNTLTFCFSIRVHDNPLHIMVEFQCVVHFYTHTRTDVESTYEISPHLCSWPNVSAWRMLLNSNDLQPYGIFPRIISDAVCKTVACSKCIHSGGICHWTWIWRSWV
jgi:hypothetical protein